MNITTVTAIALAVPALAAAGCATTTARDGLTSDSVRSGMRLEMVSESAATPSFPDRLSEPSAPLAAERLSHRIDTELGGKAHATLRVCVGGDGQVTSATVEKSTGIAALDRAFRDDAATWKYQALAAPDATACQQVMIAFHVR